MYLGKIVEMGKTDDVFENPAHPYTRALLAAVPEPDPDRARQPFGLSGEIGSPIAPPSYCRFQPRCNYATSNCTEGYPPYVEISPGHKVACYFVHG